MLADSGVVTEVCSPKTSNPKPEALSDKLSLKHQSFPCREGQPHPESEGTGHDKEDEVSILVDGSCGIVINKRRRLHC